MQFISKLHNYYFNYFDAITSNVEVLTSNPQFSYIWRRNANLYIVYSEEKIVYTQSVWEPFIVESVRPSELTNLSKLQLLKSPLQEEPPLFSKCVVYDSHNNPVRKKYFVIPKADYSPSPDDSAIWENEEESIIVFHRNVTRLHSKSFTERKFLKSLSHILVLENYDFTNLKEIKNLNKNTRFSPRMQKFHKDTREHRKYCKLLKPPFSLLKNFNHNNNNYKNNNHNNKNNYNYNYNCNYNYDHNYDSNCSMLQYNSNSNIISSSSAVDCDLMRNGYPFTEDYSSLFNDNLYHYNIF